MSSLSTDAGQGEGWTLGLDDGVPTLRVWRDGGEQVLPAASPVESGTWSLIRATADATSASIWVDGASQMERSLLGSLRPASHRHLVLAGHHADTIDGTLAR